MKDEPFSIQLQHELDHLKAIFNETDAYMFTKDLAGRYTYANQAVLDLFGCTLAELQGQDDRAFFDLEFSNAIERNDRLVLEQQIAIAQEEINYLKSTGEKRCYWTVKKPIHDKDGNLIGLCGISTDITEHKLIEARLAEQHQLLELILANVDAHIYMKDSQHRFLYVNQKVADMLGLPAEQIINRRDDEVIPAASTCQLWRLDNRVFETGELQAGEEMLTDPEGNQHYYWSVKVPFLLGDGTPTLIGISSDITELHQLKEQLHQQSVRDGLTGLYNRRFFFEMCEKNLSLDMRHHLSSVLMVLDVDQFKCINDRFGHPLGDSALVHLGRVMQSVLRSEDVLARIGGDEFAILLPNTTLLAAASLAERLRQQVMQSPLPLPDGDKLVITISAGLVENGEGELMESLYARADQMLYQAKQSGRNCVACKAG
ncbi:sensor domain-containing diguanylate cyclase [Aeromonas allosaccharophila]|uniref:sensor domain-containing diguanylate cyclase n=1 Tax=Aeromonas allosaccharophila TaxID=656 RepID=UPI0013C6B954|nr:sensor domain-containing diguanylate cyclase [Aeromonas allosaccharophila]WDO00826.1 sensor domain-containing diguanylate cyclase [Aeromonas allosaccharophila]